MRHNESKLQHACVTWFRLQYPEHAAMLFAIPNGVATSASQGRILKEEGMLAGVADLILLMPSSDHKYNSLCIEMKTLKGRQQDTQKRWQYHTEMHGNKYIIVRTFEQFCQEIKEYINVPIS